MERETHDTKGRGVWAAGTGAALGLAGWWRRSQQRRRGHGRDELLAVTVLGPVDTVERAWLDRVADVAVGDVDVDFLEAPGGRGTEVRLRRAAAPDGDGAPAADGESDTEQLSAGLRAFKSVVECGTVVRAAPQPSGRGPVAEDLTQAVTSRLRGRTTP